MRDLGPQNGLKRMLNAKHTGTLITENTARYLNAKKKQSEIKPLDNKRQIHHIIFDGISQRKSPEAIEVEIRQHEGYQEFQQYIPGWISDRFKKKRQEVNVIEKQLEKGKTRDMIIKQMLNDARFNIPSLKYLNALLDEAEENILNRTNESSRS